MGPKLQTHAHIVAMLRTMRTPTNKMASTENLQSPPLSLLTHTHTKNVNKRGQWENWREFVGVEEDRMEEGWEKSCSLSLKSVYITEKESLEPSLPMSLCSEETPMLSFFTCCCSPDGGGSIKRPRQPGDYRNACGPWPGELMEEHVVKNHHWLKALLE